MLLLEELLEFCESEYLSEDGLREIIERHGLRPNNADISDNFILEACGRAACDNELVDKGIIQCLLKYFPESARGTNDNGWTPLHLACLNKNITFDIIQLLIDAAPDSVRHVNDNGNMPLHILCCATAGIDEIPAIEILKLLLEKCPESARHADNADHRPIHIAAAGRSPEFCRVLIEAYPGSERISNGIGYLPLHYACVGGNLANVEYIYNLFPHAINHETEGLYPIHIAIRKSAVGIVQFLLDCDVRVKFQKFKRRSLLYVVCAWQYDDSNIEAGIQIIKAIYDAHPEAIEDDSFVSLTQWFHPEVQTFINGEQVYARQARDHRLMTTPDENGRLPLYHALQNNVRLGSIKLLVKGNPSAIRRADTNSLLPIQVACQHHDSPSVIQYLLDLDVRTLQHEDYDGNTALHYACSGAKYKTIGLLLEKYDAVSVSKRNAQKKLPIDLLCVSDNVEDRESAEHTESVFRLLRAYPELLVSVCIQMRQSSASDARPSPRPSDEIRKKRKIVHEYEKL